MSLIEASDPDKSRVTVLNKALHNRKNEQGSKCEKCYLYPVYLGSSLKV